MATVPTPCDELMAEAVRIAGVLPEALDELDSKGRDLIALLSEGADAATEARSKSVYAQPFERHEALLTVGLALPESANTLLSNNRTEHHVRRVEEYLARRREADARKLASEELLAELTRASQSVEAAPCSYALYIGSAEISLFALVYFHLDVVSAFLNRPTKLRWGLDAALALSKAVAIDLAGKFVFPFAGTAVAAVELLKPRIEGELERMKETAQQMDRLFQLNDRLIELLDYAQSVDATISHAETALAMVRADFDRDIDWLIETLSAAR